MLTYLGADPFVFAIAGIVVILVMLVMFMREIYPPEVTAIGGAAAMYV
ncbi:MAG: hypothetical protein HKP29_02630, partial [Silicimonas sp.]|nr:hypothetical protein [Silicimonas sp.]